MVKEDGKNCRLPFVHKTEYKLFHAIGWLLINLFIILGLNTEELNATVFLPVEQERYVSVYAHVYRYSPISGGWWETYSDRKDSFTFERFNATANVSPYGYGTTISSTQDSSITETKLSLAFSTSCLMSLPYQDTLPSSLSYKVVFDLDDSVLVHLNSYIRGPGSTSTVELTASGALQYSNFKEVTKV